MNKFKNKGFISLIIVTLLLLQFGGSLLNQKAYAKQSGSSIAGIPVDGRSNEEIREDLQKAIDQWSSEKIIIRGEETTIEIDPSMLQFNIEATIHTYETMTGKPWYAFWQSKRTVDLPLEMKASEKLKEALSVKQNWDTDATSQRVLTQASYLKSHEVEAEVTQLSLLDQERIALGIEQIPTNAVGVMELVSVLNNQILMPNEPFSVLQTFGEQLNMANEEAINFVASMIYQAALQSNSMILERTSQRKIPNYLQPGIEVAINGTDNQDLRFVNPFDNPMTLNATVENETIKVEIFAPTKEDGVTLRTVREHEIAPRIITRYAKDLAKGEGKLLQEGKPGVRIAVYRMKASTGTEELVSKDYYPPENRIVVQSSQVFEVTLGDTIPQTETAPQSDTESIDLDGDGLTDYETMTDEEIIEREKKIEAETLPPGSYYDKGGNLILQGGK